MRFFAFVLFFSTTTLAGTITVSIDTTSLLGSAAAPFSLVFALTDGSGAGDANTAVSISQFRFGAGGVTGSPTWSGGVSGSIASSVNLSDSTFLSYFIQTFAPGSVLGFTLTISQSAPESGAIPDSFSFFIADLTGQPIPTEAGPLSDTLLFIAFGAGGPTVQTFASDPTRSPAGGGNPIAIPAPMAVSDIPEPATNLLTAAALSILLGAKRLAEKRRCAGDLRRQPVTPGYADFPQPGRGSLTEQP